MYHGPVRSVILCMPFLRRSALSPLLLSFRFTFSSFLSRGSSFPTNPSSNILTELHRRNASQTRARHVFSTAGHVSREDYHYCDVTMRTLVHVYSGVLIWPQRIYTARGRVESASEARGNYCIRMYLHARRFVIGYRVGRIGIRTYIHVQPE